MVHAFRIMRKYGMNIITATQSVDTTAPMKSDPRMPVTRLRRYPGQYGLRGEALKRVRRIVAGLEQADNAINDGIYPIWPYGWQLDDFSPGRCAAFFVESIPAI